MLSKVERIQKEIELHDLDNHNRNKLRRSLWRSLTCELLCPKYEDFIRYCWWCSKNKMNMLNIQNEKVKIMEEMSVLNILKSITKLKHDVKWLSIMALNFSPTPNIVLPPELAKAKDDNPIGDTSQVLVSIN